jgi:SAM-dependent methyltransferase
MSEEATRAMSGYSAPAVAGSDSRNPLAMFLADPDSHLADILYLYFRTYKRQLIYRLFERAITHRSGDSSGTLCIADVGASMGFDMKYVLNRQTGAFHTMPPWGRTHVTLVEGDDHLIADGEKEWSGLGAAIGLTYQYAKADLARSLPLPDASQHIVLCSEVVEHLVEPERLFVEMHRVLKPGGHLILTTDNCPSALQHIRRIPRWLSGSYGTAYAPPDRAGEVVGQVYGQDSPIYGHIGLHPTRFWEQLAKGAGFAITSFGTYESVRRGGGRKTPAALAAYFAVGFLVSLLPARVGRYFGDTTAFLATKAPAAR